MLSQKVGYLPAETGIVENQSARVRLAIKVDEQKTLLWRLNSCENDTVKGSDFTSQCNWSALFGPNGRPVANTAIDHQGMVAELHKSILLHHLLFSRTST